MARTIPSGWSTRRHRANGWFTEGEGYIPPLASRVKIVGVMIDDLVPRRLETGLRVVRDHCRCHRVLWRVCADSNKTWVRRTDSYFVHGIIDRIVEPQRELPAV
jgi:hypothetical protein